MTIAERILEIVNDNCPNMSEFARRINVTPAYISKLGKNMDAVPSDRTIKDICKEFRVNENWLRTGEGDKYIPRSQNQQIAEFMNEVMGEVDDNIKKRFINSLLKLSEEDWKALDRIAKNILAGYEKKD